MSRSVVPSAPPWPLPAIAWAVGVCLCLTSPSLRAQAPPGPGAPAAFAGANELFNRGQYPDAAAAYEKLLKDYPTSEVVNGAQVQLGTALFLSARFEDAAGVLRKFLASPTSQGQNDLLEAAAALLPEALAQRASALPAAEAGSRQAAFEEAIKEYGNFLAKFPRGQSAGNAFYGRALSLYQIHRLPEAIEDLRRSLREFPTQEIAGSSQFLLALTLATQGSEAAAAEPPRAADAAKLFDEAERLLTALVARPEDLALANEAQFQLGEVLSARAGAVGGADEKTRVALLNRALDAYRGVESKEPILAAQAARIEALRARQRALTGNLPEFRRVQSARVREETKLGQLQGREDQALAARLKGAGVFVGLKRYDEARVLVRALAPAATKAADEKIVLHTLAVTYAAQGALDPALAAYEKFQAKYAGDPLGENLPLLVGNLFLSGPKADPARASGFFEEFTRLYPNSRLREAAFTEQANALARQGKFDEALAAFDRVLRSNPKRELAASAELGRAQLLQQKGDLRGALAAFRTIRDDYADRPEAAEAAFSVGLVSLLNQDAVGAVNELKAFGGKFDQSPLAPAAWLTLARAQQAAGDKAGALATLAELPGKFPRSAEAPQSYFLRASLLYADKQTDGMVKALQEMTVKFPSDPKLFDAYDTIAQVQAAAQPPRVEEAIAGYRAFLDKKAASPMAPTARLKIAGLLKKSATDLGRYLVLGAPQREVWKKQLDAAVMAAEEVLEKHPDSGAPVALALANLADCQRLLVDAKLRTDADIAAYFTVLAGRYGANPAVRSRIAFCSAALAREKDPARGLAEMRAAFDPALVFGPADLDEFAQALLKAGDMNTAAAVFAKLAADYPVPPNVSSPAQAPPDVQEAQAIALYGQGRLAEVKNDLDAAARAFEKLKATYPRSPKLAEANLGLARQLAAKGKPDDALKLLSEVARASGAPLEARARGLLLTGEVFEKKGDVLASLDTYLKVAAFYPTATAEAAEGLWKGAQGLEKQAGTLSETTKPKRSEQLARARKAYEDLVVKYPVSPFAEQAKQRLGGLAAG